MKKQKLIEINLKDFIAEFKEEYVMSYLNEFDCVYNEDINYFLKEKAIEFAKRKFASTYLVFSKKNDEMLLLGYYAIANKTIVIKRSQIHSKNILKKINHFSIYNEELRANIMPLILIGQLGKNYKIPKNDAISGNDLMALCLEKVKTLQDMSSGKFVYVECENNRSLIEFYKKHGFVPFDKRELDKEEKNIFGDKHLIQLIKYNK